MKAKLHPNGLPCFINRKNTPRIAVLIALVALITVPFFSSSLASSNSKERRQVTAKSLAAVKTERATGIRSLLPATLTESIDTFAADCLTPKTVFISGETVCARTDGVDLNFPGGRFVNWLTPSLVVAHGGSGVTDITVNPQTFLYTPTIVGDWKATIAEQNDISQTPAVFTVTPGTGLSTYAGDCTTPKSDFNLGETVCARVAGAPVATPAVMHLNWVSRAGSVVQTNDISADPQTFSFTLPSTTTSTFTDPDGLPVVVDNRGAWKLTVNSASENGVYAVQPFDVHVPATPLVDLASMQDVSFQDASVGSGSGSVFELFVTNYGPDDAQNVVLNDTIPANTTFSSVTQLGPQTFTCAPPSGGSFICSAASLPKGATARFTFAYEVDAGTPANTIISNNLSVSSGTAEIDGSNNESTFGAAVPGTSAAETCSLNCRGNFSVTADTTQGGNPGAIVNFTATDQISGNCGTITASPASGTFFAVGTTVVNVTSDTGGGNCSFTITVVNSPAPTISCPANQDVTAAVGQTSATVNPGTPVTNPSTGVAVTFLRSDDDNDPDTPPLALSAPYSIGVTNINWTVTDSTGRTATCVQRIVVNASDRENLTISCPANVTATAPSGNCEATVTLGTPTTNPSDSHVTVVGARSDGQALTDPYPTGLTQVTWTATDDINGNVATCTQTVQVSGTDTLAPTLHVPGTVSVTTSSCSATLDDELGVASAEDNCTPSVDVARTGVPANFVFPTGTTVITYTATDASGNTATATQLVIVHENTAPTITAPANVTVNTGPGATSCGTVVSNATLGNASANDNCPGVTVVRTGVPAGNNFPVGPTTVTYTATDASGNTAVATQQVTVADNTPPVIASVPAGGQTDAGSCSATIPDVATGTVASDNCAILSKTQSPVAGTAVGLGTHTITVTVTDNYGNSSQAQTTFTVNALQFTGNVWLGLKNSDDVGTKFDLLAEVLKNGTVVGSNQINDLPGGSSGFNNAILRTVNGTISSTGFCTGDTLGLRLSVRVAASSGHVSGTARLWYGDSAANSRFGKVVNGVTTTDYLRNISNVLVLNPSTGTTKFTIDVLVNRNQNGNPFKPFGTWNKTF